MGGGLSSYLSPFGLKAEGFLAHLPGVKTLAVTQRDPWATNDDEVIKVVREHVHLLAHDETPCPPGLLPSSPWSKVRLRIGLYFTVLT